MRRPRKLQDAISAGCFSLLGVSFCAKKKCRLVKSLKDFWKISELVAE